jgi:ABC-type Fe3+/spermidine/putrescine transport system ATPase subunit
MQIGTPQEIYSKPANMFAAEFIGDSTILTGTVRDDGNVELAGNVIDGIPILSGDHSRPAPGDGVNIILRAADLKIYPAGQDVSDMKDVLCLNAEAERSMFIGSLYKNIIKFHEQTIFADWEIDYTGQKIKLVIPKEKIRIFKGDERA